MPGQPILVCDDEAPIRRIIAAKLREAGFEVVEARDGKEGLAAAFARTPRLVITDFQMPALSGLELCQALKQSPVTAEVPALMLTARGYVLTPEQLAQTSIVQVIPKPFGVRQLLGTVTQVLAGGSAGKAAA